jgi:hypothetical protein
MSAPSPGPPPRPADSQVDPAVAVTRAMAGLEGLDDRPLAQHVEAFERVHTALGEALVAGSTG